ncbi:hypothetical protein [Nocardia sp. NBC_00508]
MLLAIAAVTGIVTLRVGKGSVDVLGLIGVVAFIGAISIEMLAMASAAG